MSERTYRSNVAAGQSGSEKIRPTRAHAEKDDAAFRELLEAVEVKRGIPNATIAKVIGLDLNEPDSAISRRRGKQGFEEQERRDLLRYIFEATGTDLREKYKPEEAFYYSFLNFFEAQTTSQDTARAQITGTYRLWRFSTEHPDEYVCGRLDFYEDPKTRVIKVEMYQPKLPREGVRGTEERASGFFFRVSHMYLMILRDDINRDFRATVFPHFKLDEIGTDVNENSLFAGRKRHLVHLDGFALGIDGNSGFFSPVHLELVDDVHQLAELNSKLDVIPVNDPSIPQRIADKLKRNGPLRLL